MSTNELQTMALELDLEPSQTMTSYHYDSIATPSRETTQPSPPVEQFETESTATQKTDTLLGKGGMGKVLLGRQNIPIRDVAIKILHKKNYASQRILLQEAHIMGALEHPNIIPVHAVQINEDNSVEVIMKRVQGQTLSAIVQKTAQQGEPLRHCLNILINVCHALEFAHSHSIVHRDIKSDNIMVGPFNEVYLMDWGLAFGLHTPSEAGFGVVGTPHYMAPEMLLGKPQYIDIRTDVYLIGATLHFVLTGQCRHQASSVKQALELCKVSAPFHYEQTVPKHLAQVANKACSVSPEDRFPNIASFRQALEESMRHWDAITICNKSSLKLQCMEDLLDRKDTLTEKDAQDIRRLFIQTLASFESARDIWPECIEARQGIDQALLLMITHSLRQRLPHQALSLYNDLSHKDNSLLQQIQQQIDDAQKALEAQKLAALHDPNLSRTGRKIFSVALMTSAVLVVAFAIVYGRIAGQEITTQRLIYTHLFTLVGILAGIYFGRKTLLANKYGASLAQAVAIGGVCALANAVAGHLSQAPSNLIMVVDMFILGSAFGNCRAVLQSGYKVMFLCFVFGFVSLWFPVLTHALLLSSVTISTFWSMLDWYKEAA